MWYVICPMLTLCFVGGCMLSKKEHDKIPQRFMEQEEQVITEKEKEFVINSAAIEDMLKDQPIVFEN